MNRPHAFYEGSDEIHIVRQQYQINKICRVISQEQGRSGITTGEVIRVAPGEKHMTRGRLEAFSDGVIAIIITIMVLGMKAPHGAHVEDLAPLLPTFLCYVLSFVYVGIYWNNHHHMLHAVTVVTGAMLWANLHLLFWLSLFPFATAWMGENHFTAVPTALYGVVLLMAGIAYLVLQMAIIRAQGQDSILRKAIGHDWKGKLSLVLYLIAIAATLRSSWIAPAIFVINALIWLIPDRRIERRLAL